MGKYSVLRKVLNGQKWSSASMTLGILLVVGGIHAQFYPNFGNPGD